MVAFVNQVKGLDPIADAERLAAMSCSYCAPLPDAVSQGLRDARSFVELKGQLREATSEAGDIADRLRSGDEMAMYWALYDIESTQQNATKVLGDLNAVLGRNGRTARFDGAGTVQIVAAPRPASAGR